MGNQDNIMESTEVGKEFSGGCTLKSNKAETE